MKEDPTVFVVDDDVDIRASLNRLFQTVKLSVCVFESAEQFLQSGKETSPGCLLLDVRMPGMDGMQLLERLRSSACCLPVIMLTGHGDIPMAIQALKLGALDFIEKPANHQRLLDAVRHALLVDQEQREKKLAGARFRAALAALSAREHEVMDLMVAGVPSKVMAQDLGISERTIEKHRKQVMKKMGVRSLAQLVRELVQHQSV